MGKPHFTDNSSRPLPVSGRVVAWFWILFGGLNLMRLLTVPVQLRLIREWSGSLPPAHLLNTLLLGGVGGLAVFSAVSFLNRKPWARVSLILISWLALAYPVVALFVWSARSETSLQETVTGLGLAAAITGLWIVFIPIALVLMLGLVISLLVLHSRGVREALVAPVGATHTAPRPGSVSGPFWTLAKEAQSGTAEPSGGHAAQEPEVVPATEGLAACYDLLGLEPDTPPGDVSRAYRHLAAESDPSSMLTESDRREAAERLQSLHLAFEAIRETWPESAQEFDRVFARAVAASDEPDGPLNELSGVEDSHATRPVPLVVMFFAVFLAIPLLFIFKGRFVLILLAAVPLGLAYRDMRARGRRRKELTNLAARLGWRFNPSQVTGRTLAFDQLSFYAPVDVNVKAYNTMQGNLQIAGRNFPATAGDYTRTEFSPFRKQKLTVYRFSYLILELPFRPVPDLLIRPEGFLDKVAGALGFEDIDFESAEFSRRFHVSSAEKRFAYALCHPRMMEFLLARPPSPMQLKDGYCCFTDRFERWSVLEFASKLELALGFFELWPEHLESELARDPVNRVPDR